jgi:VanZ family protein
VKFVPFDKILHFIEYGLFSFLIFRSFSFTFKKLNPNRIFILSFGFLALFALIDELHQKYIPGRYTDFYDFVFDIIGSTLLLLILLYRSRKMPTKV